MAKSKTMERAAGHKYDDPARIHWRDLHRIGFVAAATISFLFPESKSFHFLPDIGFFCTLVGAYPILHEALEGMAERRWTMDLLVSVAILAALMIREVFTALVITLFVLVAKVLETLTVGNVRRAIARLIDLMPQSKTISKIKGAAQRTGRTHSPIQTLADRFASYLANFALIGAALTFLVTNNIHATISVIIVSGAFGVAVGIALSILGALIGRRNWERSPREAVTSNNFPKST